jgi:hypothetical protein
LRFAGKTTLADSLLASNGIISARMAGKVGSTFPETSSFVLTVNVVRIRPSSQGKERRRQTLNDNRKELSVGSFAACRGEAVRGKEAGRWEGKSCFEAV